jgi:hypothetical protein
LNSWKNYFSQLLNVCEAGGIRQNEMLTAEPFVPEPSASETKFATGKMKSYKSLDVNQIPAEMFQAGEETLLTEIHKIFNLIAKRNCLGSGKSQLYLF